MTKSSLYFHPIFHIIFLNKFLIYNRLKVIDIEFLPSFLFRKKSKYELIFKNKFFYRNGNRINS